MIAKELQQIQDDLKAHGKESLSKNDLTSSSSGELKPDGKGSGTKSELTEGTETLPTEEQIMEKLGLNDVHCQVSENLPLQAHEDEQWYVNKKTKNNENISDDERHVANGYDAVVDTGKQGEESSISGKGVSSSGHNTVNGTNRSTQRLSEDNGLVTQGLEQEIEDPGYDNKLTVIEFLKQEYERNPKMSLIGAHGTPVKKPMGKGVEGKLSEKSLFQHRAASDTNLISSIDKASSSSGSNQSQDCQSGNSTLKTRVSSSFSFPELSKYSDLDRPKLVTQIGHSTLRYFIDIFDHQYLTLFCEFLHVFKPFIPRTFFVLCAYFLILVLLPFLPTLLSRLYMHGEEVFKRNELEM
jgi:hypothetical protein